MKNKKLEQWMKNKKIVTGILCIACVGTLCTGCGGSATASGNNESETENVVYGTELETETIMTATSENTELPETTETPEEITTELPEELPVPAPETEVAETEEEVVETVAKQETAKQEPVASQPETTKQETTTSKPESTKQETPKQETVKEEPKKEETKKEEAKPAHTHNWKPIAQTIHHPAEYKTVHHEAEYRTVHHPAVYEKQWVVQEEAIVVTEDVYKTSTWCNNCGMDLEEAWIEAGETTGVEGYDDWNWFLHFHAIPHQGTGSAGWTWESRVVGTITKELYPAKYEDVLISEAYDEQVLVREAYDEQVLVKAAYDEIIITGYECDCGAKK